MTQSLNKGISEALKAILNGEMDDKEIRRIMLLIQKESGDPLRDAALHQAMHFIDDHDLRLKDSEYDQFQRESLTRYIEQLN